MLNDGLNHRQELVQRLLREKGVDYGSMNSMLVRITNSYQGLGNTKVFIEIWSFQVGGLWSENPARTVSR